MMDLTSLDACEPISAVVKTSTGTADSATVRSARRVPVTMMVLDSISPASASGSG